MAKGCSCLRAALGNDDLREFAEQQPGAVWRSVVNLLSNPGQLAGKRAVVSDLLAAGLPADGDAEDPHPRRFIDEVAAVDCFARVVTDEFPSKEAPELARLLLRAGLFGDDPAFIEQTCRRISDHLQATAEDAVLDNGERYRALQRTEDVLREAQEALAAGAESAASA